MGGFSSIAAMYFDELRSLQTGYRMIAAGLPVGADLSFAAAVAPMPRLLAAFGSRPVGFVAGLFDEFFFSDPADVAAAGGSVRRSFWPETAAGRSFLGLSADEAAEANLWREVHSGAFTVDGTAARGSQTGRRIVYVPRETHPWNHFSASSVGYAIDFFSGALPGPGPNLTAGNQIWRLKVFFNFVTLAGFFLLVMPVMSLLLKLPFLRYAVTAKAGPVPSGDSLRQRVVFWAVFAVSALLPAYLVPVLMERRAPGLNVLGLTVLALGFAAFVIAVVSMARGRRLSGRAKSGALAQKLRDRSFDGSVFAVAALLLFLVTANHGTFAVAGSFFVAPAANTLLFWAAVSAGIAVLVMLGLFAFSRRSLGATPENYGIRVGADAVAASLLTALAGVAVVYGLLFALQAAFGVDARVWTLAIRTFTVEHSLTALRYAPFFFVFYLVNTVAVNANSAGRRFGTLVAVGLNVGGLLLWVAVQYAVLFATGTAWYPSMALNAILLFALIPCLAVAAVYARGLYAMTNNAYLAAFTNTALFTMITIANTAVFWNMV